MKECESVCERACVCERERERVRVCVREWELETDRDSEIYDILFTDMTLPVDNP